MVLMMGKKEFEKALRAQGKSYLSKPEREFLETAFSNYQKYNDVPALVQDLKFVLSTPEKLRLIPSVRKLISPNDLIQFDDQIRQELPLADIGSLKKKDKSKPTGLLYNGLGRTYVSSPNLQVQRNSNIRVINLNNYGDSLGFSIRGGSEHGLGIFVSQVDQGSPAALSGLAVGDHILEVNNIRLDGVPSSTAVQVLSSSNRLKMTIHRTGKVPEWKMAKEKIMWCDVATGSVTVQPPETEDPYHISGLDIVSDRRVALNVYDRNNIGLNIRGGQEYGLGIYISRVDPGGLAEANGINPGDQTLDVNGVSFKNISHSRAAEILSSPGHLVLMLRDVGKFPAYKEIYSEYTWSRRSNDENAQNVMKIENFSDTELSLTGSMNVRRSQDIRSQYSYKVPTSSSESEIYLPYTDTEYGLLSTRGNVTERQWEYHKGPLISDNHQVGERSVDRNYSDVNDSEGEFDYIKFLEKSATVDRREGKASSVSREVTAIQEPVYATVNKQNHKPNTLSSQDRLSKSFSTSAPHLNDSMDVNSRVERYLNTHDSHWQHTFSDDGSRTSSKHLDSTPSLPNTYDNRLASISRRQDEGDSLPGDDEVDVDILHAQLRQLQTRQSHLGSMEVVTLQDDNQSKDSDTATPQDDNTDEKDKSTWSTLKKKLTGSIRFRSFRKKKKNSSQNDNFSTLSKRGVFEKNFGSQMVNQQSVDKYNLMMLEDNAKKMLNEDEFVAVMRHIKTYHESHDLDRLVQVLLAILDKPEKILLLRDIRGVVYPMHIGQFDNKVNSYEVQAYEKLSTKLHLPLKHSHDVQPKPKKNLMTTVIDDNGHFHIKTMEQHHRDIAKESEVVETLQSRSTSTLNSGRATPKSSSGKDSFLNYDAQDHYIKTVYISKHKKNLGLKISGGRLEGAHVQAASSIKIDEIYPDGAAADDGSIQHGMIILSVDDHSLEGMSHEEAVAALKKSFNNKGSVAMKLVLMKCT